MTSSIECECVVLMSRSDKEDICSRIVQFWLWISYSTCLIIADKLLLSATKMVEIFRPSQKRDLREAMAMSVSKVYFKRPTPLNSVAIIERKLSNENDACT